MMSAKPKQRDHFTEAFDFGLKYLESEVHPEMDAKTTIEVLPDGTLSKYKHGRVRLDVMSLGHEMHLARGVLDEKKSSGEELGDEWSGFETAICRHMTSHGFMMDVVEFESTESRGD